MGLFKIVPKVITSAVHKAIKGVSNEDLQEIKTQLANIQADIETKLNLNTVGTLALLHYRIHKNTQRYLERGYMTINERDDLEHIYRSYEDLGGNGTAQALYEQCKNLPIKPNI